MAPIGHAREWAMRRTPLGSAMQWAATGGVSIWATDRRAARYMREAVRQTRDERYSRGQDDWIQTTGPMTRKSSAARTMSR